MEAPGRDGLKERTRSLEIFTPGCDNRYSRWLSIERLEAALAVPAPCELEVLAFKRELIEKVFG